MESWNHVQFKDIDEKILSVDPVLWIWKFLFLKLLKAQDVKDVTKRGTKSSLLGKKTL